MEPTSSITQRRLWAEELRQKGYAILSPGETAAVLIALEAGPTAANNQEALTIALARLRGARAAHERRNRGA